MALRHLAPGHELPPITMLLSLHSHHISIMASQNIGNSTAGSTICYANN